MSFMPVITFKPKLWPSIITAVMMCILFSLCYWQVQRAEWKTALIKERTEKLAEKPMVLDGLPAGPVSNLYYRGAYIHSTVKIARPYYTFTHTAENGVGFQLYFPETWNDDRWLLRQSDFLKMEEWKSANYHWPTNDELEKQGIHEQLGIFLPLESTENYFPLKEKGTERIRPFKDIEPLLFVPIHEWGSVEHELLKTRLLNIPNNHLGYAVTWFLLAFALGVTYLASHTTISFKR